MNELSLEQKVEAFKNLNTIYDEKLLSVKVTNNYSKFNNILGNRNLRDHNCLKLLQSIQKKYLLIPIMCNEKYEIIDGQHRFEVCRHLNLPIYYYIVPNYNIEEVKTANLISCNWNLDDYMNLFTSVGKSDYINFKELKIDNNISVKLLLDLCGIFKEINMRKMELDFKNGDFKLDNGMNIYNFLNALNEFKSFKECRSATFIRAFVKLYTYEKYDHQHMKKRLKNFSYKLQKRNIVGDYVTLLVDEIYCYGNCPVKFRYDAKSKTFFTLNQQ